MHFIHIPFLFNNVLLITQCTSPWVKDITIYLFDETILPLKCESLNIYESFISKPFNLNIECDYLHLPDTSNYEINVLNKKFNRVFRYIEYNLEISKIIFINCHIKLLKLSKNISKSLCSQNIIDILILDNFTELGISIMIYLKIIKLKK